MYSSQKAGRFPSLFLGLLILSAQTHTQKAAHVHFYFLSLETQMANVCFDFYYFTIDCVDILDGITANLMSKLLP